MMAVHWDESFSVGVDSIDRDHKMLLAILNDYAAAITDGKQDAVIDSIFSRLVSYCQYHFSREEDYMRSVDFPDLKAHMAQHNQFISAVNELRRRHERHDAFGANDLLNLLNEWLQRHIVESDGQYKHYLRRGRL